MVRRLSLVLLLAILALGAWAQATAANPLEGHQVSAELPGLVLIVTGDQVGATWTGPLVLIIDGRPAARIQLEPVAAALPGASALPWWRAAALAGGAGVLGAIIGALWGPLAAFDGAGVGILAGAGGGLVWALADSAGAGRRGE